jgi:hypothetical protein
MTRTQYKKFHKDLRHLARDKCAPSVFATDERADHHPHLGRLGTPAVSAGGSAPERGWTVFSDASCVLFAHRPGRTAAA